MVHPELRVRLGLGVKKRRQSEHEHWKVRQLMLKYAVYRKNG